MIDGAVGADGMPLEQERQPGEIHSRPRAFLVTSHLQKEPRGKERTIIGEHKLRHGSRPECRAVRFPQVLPIAERAPRLAGAKDSEHRSASALRASIWVGRASIWKQSREAQLKQVCVERLPVRRRRNSGPRGACEAAARHRRRCSCARWGAPSFTARLFTRAWCVGRGRSQGAIVVSRPPACSRESSAPQHKYTAAHNGRCRRVRRPRRWSSAAAAIAPHLEESRNCGRGARSSGAAFP